jgi:hypothetical protein
VFLSDGSSKALQKTFYKKNRVEKFLPKKPKTEGISKTPRKISPKKSDPGLFLASDPPTFHHHHLSAPWFKGCIKYESAISLHIIVVDLCLAYLFPISTSYRNRFLAVDRLHGKEGPYAHTKVI